VYLSAYSINTGTLQIAYYLARRTSRWIVNCNFIFIV
jgi:hypothetical protein